MEGGDNEGANFGFANGVGTERREDTGGEAAVRANLVPRHVIVVVIGMFFEIACA